MRGKDLLREIEYIDDDLIEEAKDTTVMAKKVTGKWLPWGSLAAVFVLSVIAFIVLKTNGLLSIYQDTTESCVEESCVEENTQTTAEVTLQSAAVEDTASPEEGAEEKATDYVDKQFSTETVTESAEVDMPALIMVDGVIYYDSAEINEEPRCGVMDGEITSICEEIPSENDQSNFGTGFGYQKMENRVEVLIDGEWHIFLPYSEFDNG